MGVDNTPALVRSWKLIQRGAENPYRKIDTRSRLGVDNTRGARYLVLMTNTELTRNEKIMIATDAVLAGHPDADALVTEAGFESAIEMLVETRHPAAAALAVGAPCTVGIGSDRYAGKVLTMSASLHTVVVADEQGLEWKTFRWSAKRGGYRSGSYRLHIGHAEDYRDPSF